MPICDSWSLLTSVLVPSSILQGNKYNRYSSGSELQQLVVCYKKDGSIRNYNWIHRYGINDPNRGQLEFSEQDMKKMPEAFSMYTEAVRYISNRKHELVQGK